MRLAVAGVGGKRGPHAGQRIDHVRACCAFFTRSRTALSWDRGQRCSYPAPVLSVGHPACQPSYRLLAAYSPAGAVGEAQWRGGKVRLKFLYTRFRFDQ